MEPTREEIQRWLREILRQTGETPSGLARRAGLAMTTLTRFLNDPGAQMLSLRSLAKIAHIAGVQPIGAPAATGGSKGSSLQPGMREAEAEPYIVDEAPLAARSYAIKALIRGRIAADPWTLKTRALEALGYFPGDIVIVDLNRKAIVGDVVCAQSYNWAERKAETVFRLFEPPYLVAATADPVLAQRLRKPLLVDNDHVIIKGVVTDSLRMSDDL